jgi:phosphoglycerol transferase MdoB-like AlkP superfamily enzyme
MPEMVEIQQYLVGSWRMMTGRPDGIKLLDVSADGFWNSFFAIVIALPALIAGWVTIANTLSSGHAPFGDRLSIMLRLATVDIGSWVIPLAAFAAAARPAGLADRLAHYVISSNWGSALIVWMMLPPTLLRMFFPGTDDLASAISICLFIVSLILTWRLTNSALRKGAGTATAVFGAMFVVSLIVLYALQFLLGLGSINPPAG